MSDNVNHPSHYNNGKIEVIDFIEDQRMGFNAGNVVKYVARHKHKGGLEDLKKARFYLGRMIAEHENTEAALREAVRGKAAPELNACGEAAPRLYVRRITQLDVEEVKGETATHYLIHRPTSYADYRGGPICESWPKEECVTYRTRAAGLKDTGTR